MPMILHNGFAVILAAVLVCSAMAGDVRVVAWSGQQAPGTPQGTSFQKFSKFKINNQGMVSFVARLETGSGDVTPTNNIGLWTEENGTLGLIVREGDPAPSLPSGAVFQGFQGSPSFNDSGETLFRAFLREEVGGVTRDNWESLWRHQKGSIELLARQGSQAPGAPSGAVFERMGAATSLPLNNRGQTAFRGSLKKGPGGISPANNLGIWSEGSGSLDLIAQEGSQIPGLPIGTLFGDDFGRARINEAGQTIFQGRIRAEGINVWENDGLWVANPEGSLRTVARTGVQAPGLPVGTVFEKISTFPSLNDVGQSAFSASLKRGQGGVTSQNDQSSWSEGGGTLHLIARSGDLAPGTEGAVFSVNDFVPILQNSGRVLFGTSLQHGIGEITEANDSGLWSEEDGELKLLAQKGSQAPDTPDGAVFNRLQLPSSNNFGQALVFASLKLGSGGVDNTNSLGVWAEDLSGKLRLVIRSGDVIEIAPGDFRPITIGGFLSNNRGELVMEALLSDGSEVVLVANLAVIPEPATGWLALLGGIGMLQHYHRKAR